MVERDIKAPDVTAAITAKHPPPEWATFPEMRNATGWEQSRTIDVAVFNTWPSGKGLRIAYEIKCSRGDFLKELDNPEKHAWVEEMFHETYFAAPAGLIKAAEIPEGWGLLEVRRNKAGALTCRRAVRAPRRDAKDPGLGLTLALIRRAAEQVHAADARVYSIVGTEVDADGLRRIVEEQTEAERFSLGLLSNSAQKKYEDACACVGPVQLLISMAGECGMGVSELTSDVVYELIDKACARKLQLMSHSIERARDQLGELLDHIRKD